MGRVAIFDKSDRYIDYDNPFPVQVVNSLVGFTNFIEFQEVVTVPKNVLTTVLSFTNTGVKLALDSIGGTGTARSEWFIYLNNVLKVKRRIEVANMNLNVAMHSFDMFPGDILDVKVRHPENQVQEFQCEVMFHSRP